MSDVISSIHPNDLIFTYLAKNLKEPTASEHYLGDGLRSARLLRSVIENDTSVSLDQPFEMLEFASGFGRVTRHFKTEIPNAIVTASDIHPEAMSFTERELGIKTSISQSKPESFNLQKQFDIVFALSFFSHMPDRTFGPWLESLFRHVKMGGSLIFTTHGDTTIRKYEPQITLPEAGFYFSAASEQTDLDFAEYGTAISNTQYVTRQIFRQLQAPIAVVKTGYWWEHQDTYVVAMPKWLLPCDFNPEKYLDLNPDVKLSGMAAHHHYRRFGYREGRLYK